MPCNEMSRSSNQNSDAPKKGVEKTTRSSQQSARDFIKLSHRSTPENPGLYGGMSPSDQASTSHGSRSQHDKRMLDLMQMIMHEKLDIANQLKQANQEICDKEKAIRELTNKLKQAFREKEELVDQLKEARLSGTSSLQKGSTRYI